eukprot:jgi/Chlat1/5837/Chrsp4S06356
MYAHGTAAAAEVELVVGLGSRGQSQAPSFASRMRRASSSLWSSCVRRRLGWSLAQRASENETALLSAASTTTHARSRQGFGPHTTPVVAELNGYRSTSGSFVRYNSSLSSKKKGRVTFICKECNTIKSQWYGRCPSCNSFNTMEERYEAPPPSSTGGGGAATRASARLLHRPGSSASFDDIGSINGSSRRSTWVDTNQAGPQRLDEINHTDINGSWRLQLNGLGGNEMSRVLGGGVVPGSLLLVGGDPGVGKSTLLLQVAALLASDASEESSPVLYVSGEESVEQVKSRAERMGIKQPALYLYSETNVELILEAIQRMQPRAVVIDSIQTVYLDEVTGSAGSVSQVRECATALLHAAKRQGPPIFLIGHVTKTGDIAGPRVLEHIVDVVLYMEGEDGKSHRLLRAVKNRYGATDEVGVFNMCQQGLVEVANPSELFLSERSQLGMSPAASAVAITMNGTRPFLLEVQALCASSQHPRRTATGVDGNRLHLLLAVLSKCARVNMAGQDVYVNVVAGMKLTEPATDLALVVAVASSLRDVPVPHDMAFVGEVGLGGELRPVANLERRLLEAAKLGFARCIVPQAGVQPTRDLGIEVIPCATIREALDTAVPDNHVSVGLEGHAALPG